MAFKAKDLHYDHSNEPAFLRKIREQNSGLDGRHERPVARPKRVKVDEDDDGPTYVDEEGGETLTKAEYEALVAKGDAAGNSNATGGEGTVDVRSKSVGRDFNDSEALPGDTGGKDLDLERKQKPIAEAGLGSKKRKVARVIGDEDENDDPKDEKTGAATKQKPKKKSKAKPIKLSFGDNEGD